MMIIIHMKFRINSNNAIMYRILTLIKESKDITRYLAINSKFKVCRINSTTIIKEIIQLILLINVISMKDNLFLIIIIREVFLILIQIAHSNLMGKIDLQL